MATLVRYGERIFALVVLTLLFIVNVSSLKCWLCKQGAASFDLCDQKKEKETCGPNLDMCGTFSYVDGSGKRIHAKSCTKTSYCSGNNTFCSYIPSGGKDCRVQCCSTELCNFDVGFASTVAPTTIPAAPPTTNESLTTTKRPTTRPAASTTPVPISIKTVPPTTFIADPNKDGQGGGDDDDCSWVKSSSFTLQISSISLIGLVLLVVNFY